MKKQEIILRLSSAFDSYQAQKILQKITGLSGSQLFLCEEILNINQAIIDQYINKYNEGVPFEYILQQAEFYHLEFYVDERTLIPRNDTEGMVSEAIKASKKIPDILLIDVGTGSSCIPLSILKNSDIQICVVIDISEKALEVSAVNIKKHGGEKKITQYHGSLLEPLLIPKNTSLLNSLPLPGERGCISENNAIITANLPYIKQDDFENMDASVIHHEPDTALYGGKETGFELYEALIDQCMELKKKNNLQNIILFIEIGFDQYIYSKGYLKSLRLDHSYFKDNSGIWRCIKIVF